MIFTDIQRPSKGDTTTYQGVEYVFDGYGWVKKEVPFEEEDPIYKTDKGSLAKKSDIPSLDAYAKKSDIPSLTDYAKKSDIPSLTDYAKKSDIPSLTDYAKKTEIPAPYCSYTDTIFRKDVYWDNDLIRLKQTAQTLDVKQLIVRTSFGDTTLDFKIVYNNGYAWLSGVSKNDNWEYLIIAYNLVPEGSYQPDLRGKIGRNYMQDEDSGNSYHAGYNTEMFNSVYKGYGGKDREALNSLKLTGGSIWYGITDEMAVKYKFNILARSYVAGSLEEEVSSCPDILSVGAHYGNYYYEGGAHGVLSPNSSLNVGVRHDITSAANIFLRNTIAVTAGETADGLGIWASYGYGVEFCETWKDFDSRYDLEQFKTFFGAIFSCYVDTDRRTVITKYRSVDDRFKIGLGTDVNSRYVGETLWLAYKGTNIEFKIAELIDDYTLVADRDLPVMASSETYYVWTYYNAIHEICITYAAPQQSATCSIIAAKLAIIQDLTDANWQLVREAARMTASCSTYTVVDGKKVWATHWDMKRGFGIINVSEAVQYIKDNYSENSDYKDNAVVSVPRINSLLSFDDLDNDQVVSKKMVLDVGEGVQGVLDLKEDKLNKVISFQTTPDDNHYPSEKLVKTGLDSKANSTHTHAISDVVNLSSSLDSKENISNKKTSLEDNSDNYYPTQKAVKTAIDAKASDPHDNSQHNDLAFEALRFDVQTAPAAPSADKLYMYLTASGVSPNRVLQLKVKDEKGNETVLISVTV